MMDTPIGAALGQTVEDLREKKQVRVVPGDAEKKPHIAYENGAFAFTTLGYGHGVGMSQAAAVTLAEGGMTVDEILARFYPGTDIKSEMPCRFAHRQGGFLMA